jgi:hypothetical protein
MDQPTYQRLADIAVEVVQPVPRGFALLGEGPEGAEYQVDLHFGMPLDSRTRAVLGELLSQADITISRKAPPRRHSSGPRTGRRERAHNH